MKLFQTCFHFIFSSRVFAVIFSLVSTSIVAQQASVPAQNHLGFNLQQKGDFYASWGYNKSWFNKSDIHFSGQGHDFVLYDVKAKDRPSELNFDYINPSKLTIPQFNFHIGYFISDKYSISIGWDHMKYVAVDFQKVIMKGFVDPSGVSDSLIKSNMEHLNSKYSPSGTYQNVEVQMTPNDFVDYEHTDGLNYASIEIERYDELWQNLKNNKLGITLVSGVGTGLIIPRTYAHLFGSGRNHYWNVSGWGINTKVGLKLNLTRHIYLQTDFKYGYLQMQNVHTTDRYQLDKAQQNIVFYENYWLIGFRF